MYLMELEYYIISIGLGVLACLSYYWFNKINTNMDNFIEQCNNNKSNITRNHDKIIAVESSNEEKAKSMREINDEKMSAMSKETYELAKDMRLMVKSITDLTKTVAIHEMKILNLEEFLKGNYKK